MTFDVSREVNQHIPEAIENIRRDSELDSLADQIKYYDEVLTQSARNYAFTGNVEWKSRYQENVVKLDEVINKATDNGDNEDKNIFSSINDANLKLVKMEKEAISFADEGNLISSQQILESTDYKKQKNIYQNGLEEYFAKKGAKLDQTIEISTADITEIIKDVQEDGKYIQIIIGGLALFLVILLSFLYYFLKNSVLKRLANIQDSADEIASGKFDQKITNLSDDEIGDLGRSFNIMAEHLSDSYRNLEKKVKERTNELEEKLEIIAKQEKQLDLAIKGTKLGTWEWNVKKGEVKFNERWAEIIGYKLKELEPTSIKTWEKYSHPEDLKKSDQILKAHFAGKTDQYVFETRMKHKNGSWVWVLDQGKLFSRDEKGNPLMMIGTHLDITERKRQEKELEKLASIVENTEEAIIGKTLDGIITSWNHGAEELYGYKAKEIIGKSIKTIVPKDHFKEIDNILKIIKSGKAVKKIQTVRLRKDGSLVDVSLSISPIKDSNDEITGASTIGVDITKEKQIDKAKTEFVSLASHQLRTPLSAVNWYAEMLLDGDVGKLTPDQKKYVEEIYSGNQRMVDLVNALLDVSRIELGTFAVQPEKTNVVDIAKSLLKEVKADIEKKHQKVIEKYGENLPLIMADKKLLRIVIQNLLTNAIKYTPDKGKITIEVLKEEPNLEINISDTGYGIPKSQQSRIFEKLFRADNIRAKDTEGTGLGLYIVKSIVTHSGGNIRFDSEENKGTTFYVSLPLKGMSKKEGTKALEDIK